MATPCLAAGLEAPSARTYSVFVKFRRSRLRLAQRLSSTQALAFAQNVRKDRFRDPEGVFLVDDLDGTLVDESTLRELLVAGALPNGGEAAEPPPEPASFSSLSAEPTPEPARPAPAPTIATQPHSLDDLLETARQADQVIRFGIERQSRLAMEQRAATRALQQAACDLWHQVEELLASLHERRQAQAANARAEINR